MKQLTSTKATYRAVEISVSFDRFEGKTMFCCDNTLSGPRSEDKWFPTQRAALANERLEIDSRLGFSQ
jgi:hypothetical protein